MPIKRLLGKIMNDFTPSAGDYFERERERYEPITSLSTKGQTGFLQKLIDRKIEEKFQKRDIEQASEIRYLRMQVETFRLLLKNVTIRLEVLEKLKAVSGEDVIEVRDISMEQTKKEMLSLLSDGKTRYADEIATELKLDIRDVIEAFKQLHKEGKLSVDEDKL